MKYYCIVLAAGNGIRMNLSYPKQFFNFKKIPLIVHTLKQISSYSIITDIIVVVNKEYVNLIKKYINTYNIQNVKSIIIGGNTRQISVLNGLLEIDEKNSLVAIHDGVRPVTKEYYFSESYNKLMTNNDIHGVIVGYPVKDTIKIMKKDSTLFTPDRSTLYAVQTPQIFKSTTLIDAYKKLDLSTSCTDDASVVELYGGKVEILFGGYDNIKITTKEDIHFLESIWEKN